jgi:hypothetical protein
MEKQFIDFNSTLVRSLEEVISDVLGTRVLPPFLKYLATHYDITTEEIPYRFETVLDTLEELFGVGGRTLGKLVVKRFYTKLGLEFTEPNRPLIQYVARAKMMLQDNESVARLRD